MERVACVIFDSHACMEAWRASGCRMPGGSGVVHLGVEERLITEAARMIRREKSARESVRRALGVGPDEMLLSLFATYERRKGQDSLVALTGRMLETEPALPLRLLLIGFPLPEARADFLARLTPAQRIAITPERARIREADLAPYYLASDAYVMNSQPPGEPFGRVTIEAMTFGLPVLGSAAGGTLEIIRDGKTGWLHPAGPDGEAQLERNIRTVLARRRTARARGRAGQKLVREYFNETRFADNLAAVLRPLVQDRPETDAR